MSIRSAVALVAACLLTACTSGSPDAGTPAPQSSLGAEARVLLIGETVTGVVDSMHPTWGDHGGFDLYSFQANAGDRVIVELRSEDFDPYLVIGSESGGLFNPVAQDDDSGDELNARIRFDVPAAGTYRILAQAYAAYGAGGYTLSLQQYVPQVVESVALALGEPVEAFLDEEDAFDEYSEIHYDEYTFQAEVGQRYAVSMSSADLDAYLLLGTGSGDAFEEIASDDDHGDGYDARILFSPDATGEYVVHATSYDGASAGAYTIHVAQAAPPGPVVVTPLTLGQTVDGALTEDDQVAGDGAFYDIYRFTGDEGDRVQIVLRSDEFDSYLELGEPAQGDEFRAEHSDDDGAGNLDSRIVVTLWQAGEYEIRARSLSPDETGAYSLSIEERREEPVEPGRIGIGQSVDGSLDDASPMLDDGSFYDVYLFEGTAGQRIRVLMTSDDVDSFLQLGPWSGDEIEVTHTDDDSGGGNSGVDAMIELTLPGSGTWAIMANTVFANEAGLYTLTLEQP